jgi:predicted esterase
MRNSIGQRRRLRRTNAIGATNYNCIVFFVFTVLFLGWAWSLMTFISLTEQHEQQKDHSSASSDIVGHSSPERESSVQRNKATSEDVAQPVYGTHQQLVWGDGTNPIEAVYALPNTTENLKGIVLLLHACTHNALKFFSPSDSCPSCLGLAEELRIVRLVLSRGYAALAVTCHDKTSGCWSDADLPRLDVALDNFRKHLLPKGGISTDSINIIAIGASSGGHMAAKVVAEGKAAAALVMVMALRAALQNRLTRSSSSSSSSSSHPIYLAPMPRDQGMTRKAEQNYQTLQQAGIPVFFDKTSCVPLPVTVAYLSSRVPGMTQSAAENIVQGLLEAHHLQEDYMLQKDPTKSNWREILQTIDYYYDDVKSRTTTTTEDLSSLLWGQFLLTPGKSPLAKALHRAWAFHEYCSEVVEPALDFFEQTLANQKTDIKDIAA